MASRDQPGQGWAVDLGRQPARIVEGQPEGPYADAFEIICCVCDHPSTITVRPHPGFSGSAGHDPIADGVTAPGAAAGRRRLQGTITDAG